MLFKRNPCMLSRRELKKVGTQEGLHSFTPEQVAHIRYFLPRLDLTKVSTEVYTVMEKVEETQHIVIEEQFGLLGLNSFVHPDFYHQLRVGDKVEFFFMNLFAGYSIPIANTVYDASRPEVPALELTSMEESFARLDAYLEEFDEEEECE